MGSSHIEVLQERHHVGGEVVYPAVKILLSADVEGDGAEVVREGRNLLEESPPPEAEAAYQDQGRALAVDVVVYAGFFGDHHWHVVLPLTSRSAPSVVGWSLSQGPMSPGPRPHYMPNAHSERVRALMVCERVRLLSRPKAIYLGY